MKQSKSLLWLVFFIVLLGATAAAAGLFGDSSGSPFMFTTVHGESVRISGEGLYRFDTAFKAPILRGTDAVTLFLAIPLLIAAVFYFRRGSIRGGLMLAGMLSYFLYNAASLAFGVAYNRLFLLYIAYFASSLFAFVLAVRSIDSDALARRISERHPRRAIAGFLFLAGMSVFVWLIEIITALSTGGVPEGVASYTTEVTTVIDLGIIAPTAFLAGALVLRRRPLGYLLAPILMVLNAIIGVVIVAQTVAQSMDGITLTTQQLVIYVGIFVAMSLVALCLTWLLLRSIVDTADGFGIVQSLPSSHPRSEEPRVTSSKSLATVGPAINKNIDTER
jgi:hypothetical protein